MGGSSSIARAPPAEEADGASRAIQQMTDEDTDRACEIPGDSLPLTGEPAM
jgi:hypothetical protein